MLCYVMLCYNMICYNMICYDMMRIFETYRSFVNTRVAAIPELCDTAAAFEQLCTNLPFLHPATELDA